MTSKQTYYNVLGIKPNASVSDVTAAYKSRVKAFYAGEKYLKENNIQIQDILIANEILSDSKKRRDYDRCLGGSTQDSDVVVECESVNISDIFKMDEEIVEVSYEEDVTEADESNEEEIFNPFEIETRHEAGPTVEIVSEVEKVSKEQGLGSELKKKKRAEVPVQPKKTKETQPKQKAEDFKFKFDYKNENYKNESDFKLDLDNQIDKFNAQVEKYTESKKNLRKTFLLNKKKRLEMRTILSINRKILVKQYDTYTKSLDKYLASTLISIENMHTKKINQKIYANNSRKASQKNNSIDSSLYSKKHYSNVCKELKKREKQKNAEVNKYKKQDKVFKEYIAYIETQED